jgi:hypothetical protein
MAFSKLKSATTRLSRTFSFSNSLRRLSCFMLILFMLSFDFNQVISKWVELGVFAGG